MKTLGKTFGKVEDFVNENEGKGMKIYISGKIAGLPESEYTENFSAVEEYLTKKGFQTINPVTLIGTVQGAIPWTLSQREIMDIDLTVLAYCDAIYLMKNWKESRGAREEYRHAIGNGLDIIMETS